MTARWHLGPIDGFHFWTILAFSPEILVFLFFMLTDPKTVPAGKRRRVVFGSSVALLAAFLVALSPTEFWSKVAVLAALAVVCAARPLAVILPSIRPGRRSVVALAAAGVVTYSGALVVAGMHTGAEAVAVQPAARATRLPRIVIQDSKGVDSTLDRRMAMRIAADLQRRRPALRLRRVTVWLEAARDQFPVIVARLESASLERTVEVTLSASGYRVARIRG